MENEIRVYIEEGKRREGTDEASAFPLPPKKRVALLYI